MAIRKAVVPAAGRGTRMRTASPAIQLAPAQASAADAGDKALVAIHGRPFIQWVVQSLADVGIREVCIIRGPRHDTMRSINTWPRGAEITFATQEHPRGGADALIAAESFAAGDAFLFVNADNLYPRDALQRLVDASRAAVVGFDRNALTSGSNIDASRIASYAVLDVASDGTLRRITEKPDAAHAAAAHAVSMNCWTMPCEIFQACRSVTPSSRGELELQSAVQYAIDVMGVVFDVIPCAQPVLDLTTRSDIAAIETLLHERAQSGARR